MRGMPRCDIAERHGRSERDAGTRIDSAHDRIHVIAAGIKPGDAAAVLAQHLRMLIGDEAATGADVARKHLDRIEWRLRHGPDAGIGAMSGVAEIALIVIASLAKFGIDAGE